MGFWEAIDVRKTGNGGGQGRNGTYTVSIQLVIGGAAIMIYDHDRRIIIDCP